MDQKPRGGESRIERMSAGGECMVQKVNEKKSASAEWR